MTAYHGHEAMLIIVRVLLSFQGSHGSELPIATTFRVSKVLQNALLRLYKFGGFLLQSQGLFRRSNQSSGGGINT